MNAKSHLPDITSQPNSLNARPLQWVGMEGGFAAVTYFK